MTQEEFYRLKLGDKVRLSTGLEGIIVKEPGIKKEYYLNGERIYYWGTTYIIMQITNQDGFGWDCDEGSNYYGLSSYECLTLLSRAAKKNQRIPIKYKP